MALFRFILHFNQIIKAVFLIALIVLLTSPDGLAKPDWLKEVLKDNYEIDIDPEADAIVLYHVEEIEVSKSGKTERLVKKAVKVLSATQNVEDALMEGLSSKRKIDDIKGWLITPEGKEIDLDDKNIITMGLPQSYGYYTDISIVTAGFDDVKAGDVVAYEYKIKEDPTWDGYYQSFIFQKMSPVVYAAIKIKVPDGWQMYYSSQNIDDVRSYKTEERHIWEASNLPHIPDEPYMPEESRLVKSFFFSCFDPEGEGVDAFKNWEAVSAWLDETYQDVRTPTEEIASFANQMYDSASTTIDKIAAIGNFVQKEIRYVAVEIDQGRFVPRFASETFENKYGDCKDKTTLMLAMLRTAGIEAYPALVNTEQNIDSLVPTPFQFNHVIVCIPAAHLQNDPEFEDATAGELFFFDPTDASIPLGMLPGVLYGAKALVGWEGAEKLITLPYPSPAHNFTKYAIRATITDENALDADVRISYYAGRAEQMRYQRQLKSAEDRQKRLLNIFSGTVNNPSLENIAYGEDSDSLWVDFHLTGVNYLINAGNMSLFKVNFLQDDDIENISSNKRVNPFDFGNSRRIESEITWVIPQGNKASLDFYSMADTVSNAFFEFNAVNNDTTLDLRYLISYNGDTAPPAELEGMKEFIQGIISIFRLRAVIKP